MKNQLDVPFESIESAQEFLRLLATAVYEARLDVEADVWDEEGPGARRQQALRLVVYKLEQLEKHVQTSQRLLNDLRSLRRLLFQERVAEKEEPESNISPKDFPELNGAR